MKIAENRDRSILAGPLTAAISVWMMNKYRKTGVVPGSKSNNGGAYQPQVDDAATKDAWSTRIDEPDSELYGHGHGEDLEDNDVDRRKYGQVHDYDEHEHEPAAMPKPLSLGKENEDVPAKPKASVEKDEEKWCALCEKDGHLAFDCPEEAY